MGEMAFINSRRMQGIDFAGRNIVKFPYTLTKGSLRQINAFDVAMAAEDGLLR